MNTAQNIQITEQIQTLARQDLIQLRAFIDDLIRTQQPVSGVEKITVRSARRILSDLKPIGIPGPKIPFNRNMIYDDLTI